MNLSKLIDICVKVWPPRVTVIVNLFGEVHLPVDAPKPAALHYGDIKVHSFDEYSKRQKPSND